MYPLFVRPLVFALHQRGSFRVNFRAKVKVRVRIRVRVRDRVRVRLDADGSFEQCVVNNNEADNKKPKRTEKGPAKMDSNLLVQ